MDVKTVCLGLLTQGPASGYDLKKTFESTFGHFFAAGFGSIYPALGTLAEAGLVTCTEVPQDGKPDRKVYSITDDGREAFTRASRGGSRPMLASGACPGAGRDCRVSYKHGSSSSPRSPSS